MVMLWMVSRRSPEMRVVNELGIQGVNPQGLSGVLGFPTVAITGFQSLRVNPAGNPLQNDILKTFADAVTS